MPIGRPRKYPEGTERITVRLPKSLLRVLRDQAEGKSLSEVIIDSLKKVLHG